ncbi:hypothetical protein KJ688_14930 [bacterium]|nr:hypothetical protein [bacterium]
MKDTTLKNVILCLLFISIICCEKDKNPLSNNFQNGDWNIISSLNEDMCTVFFIDSMNGWAVGYNGQINITTDGGVTWSNQNSGTTNKLTSVYFLNNQTGFASGYNNTLIYTNNKGNTWVPIQVASDSGSIYSCLHSDDANNLYFISNYGEVYWSNDLGESWNNKHNFDNWGFSYLDYSNNPTCYAMQFGGNSLYKTTDGGNSWNIYTIPLQWSGDIYFFDKDHGWITENWAPSSMIHDSTSIYMTNDGGETWIQQSSLSGLVLDNIVFVDIFHGWVSKITKIYYTSDSGKTWTCQFESDEIGYIRDIFFVDINNGWALTSEGILVKYSCD